MKAGYGIVNQVGPYCNSHKITIHKTLANDPWCSYRHTRCVSHEESTIS